MQARDPVTGQMMSYSELSKLMQARRQQAIAQQPYVKEGYSIVAKQPKNSGPPVQGNIFDGWINKNIGGGIPDLNDPTNRDSVPAMLTPGEYVVNKEATQMYGDVIHQMNQHGLQQRHMENQMYNIGGKVKKLYEEGYDAPGQAYAIAKSMGYNTGGLVSFLKKHEGWRDKAYQDSGGVWTIGYGRTRNADGSPVTAGQTTTKEAEDSWIEDRANQEWTAINDYAKEHNYDWSDKEKEAFASFRYNGGQGMIDKLTANGTRDMDTIKSKFGLYNKAGGKKVDGLVNRRNYEMEHAGWGTVGEAPEGSSATTFQLVGQGTPEHVEEVERPVPPVAGSVPVVPQPDAPVEREVDVSPTAEAGDQMGLPSVGGIGIQELIPLLGGGGAPPGPMLQHGGMQPIQSASQIREGSNPMNRNKFYNEGGQVPPVTIHLNDGGWLSNLFGWNNNKQAADALARRPGIRSADVLQGLAAPIDPRGPQQPDTPSQFGADMVPPVPTANPDVRPNTAVPTANHAANRMEHILGGVTEAVPQLDTAPPVPGSDEALLQGSSDNVERVEGEVAQLRKQYLGMESTGNAGIEFDPRGNNQVPTPDWQMTPEGMSVTQPVNPEVIDRTPSVAQAWGLDIPNTRGAVPGVPDTPLRPDVPVLDMASPEAPVDEAPATGIYAGWDQATPEQIAAEAQPKDVQQADGHNADLPVEDQVVKGSQAKEAHNIPIHEKKVAVQERLKVNNETATQEETARAEAAGAKAKPERIEAAKTVLQENFGGLFDKKELMRAAVLFAGAMLTGASPQKALAIAGQMYMGRLDAKEAARVKTEQQAAAAAAKRQPTIDMTQKDTFIVDGKKVNAYKMTSYGPNGEKIHSWVDSKTQQPISASAHQNFDTTPGTPEYNKRVQDESKQYSGILDEVLNQPSALDKDGNQITGILPKSSGPQVAKWAIKNNIPPEAMGQLLQNAGNAAIADSRGGTQARSIEAYLNEQYIESQIGDPSLFQGVQADEISGLMQDIASRAGLEGSVAQVSTPIIQAALPMWDALSPEDKERYARKAKGTNKSPFMIWMEEDLNS